MFTATMKRKFIFISLTIALLAVSTTSFACRNDHTGYGHGTVYSKTSLTAEQQQQLDAVTAKYSEQLNELRASLETKREAYRAAKFDDSTTIGTLRQLEADLDNLKQQYWALLDKANTEAGGLITTTDSVWYNCGYDDDRQHHHRGWMAHGNHMGYGYGSGPCWRN